MTYFLRNLESIFNLWISISNYDDDFNFLFLWIHFFLWIFIELIHYREGLKSKKRVTKLVLVVITVFIGRIHIFIFSSKFNYCILVSSLLGTNTCCVCQKVSVLWWLGTSLWKNYFAGKIFYVNDKFLLIKIQKFNSLNIHKMMFIVYEASVMW